MNVFERIRFLRKMADFGQSLQVRNIFYVCFSGQA